MWKGGLAGQQQVIKWFRRKKAIGKGSRSRRRRKKTEFVARILQRSLRAAAKNYSVLLHSELSWTATEDEKTKVCAYGEEAE